MLYQKIKIFLLIIYFCQLRVLNIFIYYKYGGGRAQDSREN